jgi:hypothetical protein
MDKDTGNLWAFVILFSRDKQIHNNSPASCSEYLASLNANWKVFTVSETECLRSYSESLIAAHSAVSYCPVRSIYNAGLRTGSADFAILGLGSSLFPWSCSATSSYVLTASPTRAQYSIHLILHDLFSLREFGVEYKLRKSLLCHFLCLHLLTFS